MEGVILSVGHDDVVHKVYAHELAGTLDALGEFFVGTTGRKVPGRMIMAYGEDGGIGEDGLAEDDTDIDGCLGDASM